MRAIGTANAWFSFKGIRNDAYDVRMIAPPNRPHPAAKGKQIDIPGRNGKLWQGQKAYSPIVITQRVIAYDNANIDDISAWLSGAGDLIFGDEPERVYHAQIIKEYTRSNQSARLRGQAFTITFDCEPFRYNAKSDLDTIIAEESATMYTNPGTVYSQPLIIIEGSGSGNLEIGLNTLLVDDLTAGVPLYVDCAALVAYTGGSAADDPMLLATQHITGEWPKLQPGIDFINFTGGITRVTIHPRWRWI